MKILLATLALNEMEWLPLLYEQHKDWPGLHTWVFVEGADPAYAAANPDRVTAEGLSVDGTGAWLRELTGRDRRVVYCPCPLGQADRTDLAQGKVPLRNRYLEVADTEEPNFVFVLDADEFYCRAHQERITSLMQGAAGRFTSFLFGLRSLWRPPSIAQRPLFELEARGCLWSVPICRGWRWVHGMRYRDNHNTPQTPEGRSLLDAPKRYDRLADMPYCTHLGFTASLASRRAKHAYYVYRGEGRTDRRQKYVDCRAAFETWTPGTPLPHGAEVVRYAGEVPEVFRAGGR